MLLAHLMSFLYFSGKLYPSGMIFIPNKLNPKKSTFLWYFAVDLKVNKYVISVKLKKNLNVSVRKKNESRKNIKKLRVNTIQ